MRTSRPQRGLALGLLAAIGLGVSSPALAEYDYGAFGAEPVGLLVDEMARLHDISYQAAVAVRDQCGYAVGTTVGFSAARQPERPWRESAEQNWEALSLAVSFDRGLATVLAVSPVGPGALAGLKKGDVITHINNTVAVGDLFESSMLGAYGRTDPVVLRVRRQTKELTVSVTPVPACAIPVRMVSSMFGGVFFDESTVYVPLGMMRSGVEDSVIYQAISDSMISVATTLFAGRKDKRSGGRPMPFDGWAFGPPVGPFDGKTDIRWNGR